MIASKQPGKKIYTAQNRRNDLFTLSFAYEFGSRSDKLVCHALQVAEQSGAGSLDSVAFKRELYTLGTSIRTRCDDEEIIISLSGLDRNLERSLELYQTWISEPALVAEMAKAAGEIEISKRRANLDNPRYLSRALSAYANFGKNSSYLFEASNQAVGKASTAQLRKSVRNLGELAHHTFYFGPRNGAEIAPIVEPSGKLRAGKLPATLKFRKVQKPTIFYLDYPSAQSVIQVTFGHEPASAQERALLALLDEYVGGGMGGLMFQEIREARGLAYSATGSTFSGRREKDETALLTYVATQTDKTQEALRVTLELLRSPISPNRLAQAKRSFEERARTTRVDPRAVTSTVYSWNLQGKTADPGPEELAIIQSASIEQVQALLDTLTKEKAPIISVLGNRKNLDPKVLEQFGTVTEVKVDQLTSFGKF